MEAEFLQLARQTAAAMQGPSWVEIAQLLVSGVGLGCIVWGLFSMKAAGKRRDREIDALVESMRENTRTVGLGLERQGEAMTLAFTQQGQALERQAEAMTQAFTQQGEVLAELLRRSNPA